MYKQAQASFWTVEEVGLVISFIGFYHMLIEDNTNQKQIIALYFTVSFLMFSLRLT